VQVNRLHLVNQAFQGFFLLVLLLGRSDFEEVSDESELTDRLLGLPKPLLDAVGHHMGLILKSNLFLLVIADHSHLDLFTRLSLPV